MNSAWQLQKAKNQLSHLVNCAAAEGPQVITRHGKKVAVVLAYEQYQQITHSNETLLDFFQAAPTVDDFEVTRDRSSGRNEFNP